jgi:hypothetical protein
MRYAVVTVTDGNFLIRSEWGNKEGAIRAFYGLTTALLDPNAGFNKGYIAIMDSNLDILPDYKEYIEHEPVVVQTPVSTEEEGD